MMADEFNCGCVWHLGQKKGEELEGSVILSPIELAVKDCPDCGGTGVEKPATKPCPICEGKGWYGLGESKDGPLEIEERDDGTTLIRATGSRPSKKTCPACKGLGTVPKDAAWLDLDTMEVSANISVESTSYPNRGYTAFLAAATALRDQLEPGWREK
jgi:hypothetical protein